jgi:hypothetical protein
MNRFVLHTSFPGDHRELEPPDPLPNSVVKWFIADGSVGFPHVRVGHRQDSKLKTPVCSRMRGFFWFGIRCPVILCAAEGSQKPLVRSLVAALCRDAITLILVPILMPRPLFIEVI